MFDKEQLEAIGSYAWKHASKDKNAKEMQESLKLMVTWLRDAPDDLAFAKQESPFGRFLENNDDESPVSEDEGQEDNLPSLLDRYYELEATKIGLEALLERQPSNVAHKDRIERNLKALIGASEAINSAFIKDYAGQIAREAESLLRSDDYGPAYDAVDTIADICSTIAPKIAALVQDPTLLPFTEE